MVAFRLRGSEEGTGSAPNRVGSNVFTLFFSFHNDASLFQHAGATFSWGGYISLDDWGDLGGSFWDYAESVGKKSVSSLKVGRSVDDLYLLCS